MLKHIFIRVRPGYRIPTTSVARKFSVGGLPF